MTQNRYGYWRVGLTAGILVAALAGMAQAGGYQAPVVEQTVTPPAAPPAAIYAGAYVGGSIGYAFGGDDKVGIKSPSGFMKTYGKLQIDGPSAGLQAGYRWFTEPVYWGVELGLSGGNISDSYSKSESSAKNDLNYALSLRGSIGTTVGQDVLLYSFAGVSYGDFDYKASDYRGANIDTSFDRTGYLLGFGIEKALDKNWSVKGEYQYADYGDKNLKDDNGFATKATPKYSTVSIGVNYRF